LYPTNPVSVQTQSIGAGFSSFAPFFAAGRSHILRYSAGAGRAVVDRLNP
jgi:hypothetical protein